MSKKFLVEAKLETKITRYWTGTGWGFKKQAKRYDESEALNIQDQVLRSKIVATVIEDK